MYNSSMELNHVGIFNTSAEHAERFYGGFLGLEKIKEGLLPADLAAQLFNINHDVEMMVYGRDGLNVEIFICPECSHQSPDISHIGLYLDNLNAVIEDAGKNNVEHLIGQTKDKTVHFLKDFSGNLIEIKQK